MSQMDYCQWEHRVIDLYMKGNYEEALEIAYQIEAAFPGEVADAKFMIACLKCRLGKYAEAEKILAESAGKGLWWSPHVLMGEEDLKPLRDLPGFQEVVSVSEVRFSSCQASARPKLLVVNADSRTGKAMPLILAMHGRGQNIQSFSQKWSASVFRDRYVFAFPQSSQVYGINKFCWDDESLAGQEVLDVYRQMEAKGLAEAGRVIVAGFSQGGRLSTSLALAGGLPAGGFLAIAPAIRDIPAQDVLERAVNERKIRGCIIIGDQDQFYGRVREFYAALEKAGLPCKLIVQKGQGHFMPEKLSLILPDAVSFILKADY